MIKYLICLLWGHTLRYRVYNSELTDNFTSWYKYEWHDKCPRCGKNFTGENK